LGRAGADQPEVIQVGAAVGPHEEVVGEHVVLGPLPEWQSGAVVVTHDQRARVRSGDEAVVATAVDLLHVLVEAMDEIARGRGQWRRGRLDARVGKPGPGSLPRHTAGRCGSGEPSRSTWMYCAGVALAMPLAPGKRP